MNTDKLLVCVTGALFIGFGIGFAAGLDNPPIREEIEWETLLAGAAAILGGWFAYSGAVAPMKNARQQMKEKFRHSVDEACQEFRDMLTFKPVRMSSETRAEIEKREGRTLSSAEERRIQIDSAQVLLRMTLADFLNEGRESRICRAAAAIKLPEVPDDIVSHKILAERSLLERNLKKVADFDCNRKFVTDVRDQMVRFLNNITVL